MQQALGLYVKGQDAMMGLLLPRPNTNYPPQVITLPASLSPANQPPFYLYLGFRTFSSKIHCCEHQNHNDFSECLTNT